MVMRPRTSAATVHDERGFTLVEMMIAAALTMVVVGAAVALSTTVQNVYSYELEDAAAQQEARFAMDWISRTIAAAGSFPYGTSAECATAEDTPEYAPGFVLDPDDDGNHDDIRVLSDSTRPNGLIGGTVACDEEGEDVTIAHDSEAGTITRLDVALGGTAAAMTDAVVSDLDFTYLDASRAAVDDSADVIEYVQISLTVRSKARNPLTNENATFTYTSEVRVRTPPS